MVWSMWLKHPRNNGVFNIFAWTFPKTIKLLLQCIFCWVVYLLYSKCFRLLDPRGIYKFSPANSGVACHCNFQENFRLHVRGTKENETWAAAAAAAGLIHRICEWSWEDSTLLQLVMNNKKKQCKWSIFPLTFSIHAL